MLFGDVSSRLIEVLEDHEDQVYEYDGSNLSIINDTSLEGDYLLDLVQFGQVGHQNVTVSRGNTYGARVIVEDSGGYCYFIVGVQDSANAVDDGYGVSVNPGSNELNLVEFQGGGSTTIDSESVTLSADTEYRIEFEYAPTGSPLVATLKDSSDNVLATVSGVNDTHSGGTFGWYGGDSSNGCLVDYVTRL